MNAASHTIGSRPLGYCGRNGLHKLRPPPSSSAKAKAKRAQPAAPTRRGAVRPVASAARDNKPKGPSASQRSTSPPRGPAPAAAATRSGWTASTSQQQQQKQQQPEKKTPSKPSSPLGGAYRSLIGNTPLVDLSFLSEKPGVRIYGKAEFLNPSGSIKDRIANHIINKAEKEGKLRPGGTVVAATSGNTGSAVAMVCAMRGYKYIVITNAKTSKEKRDSMAAYGGQVLVGPCGVSADDPMHYQNMARTLCAENPDYFDVDQYDNPNNPEAYYLSLGPEIWEQTEGAVSHFVAGGSTGGTISGTGRYLKEQNREVQVCMPDPKGSVFWDYWQEGIPESELEPKSYQVRGQTSTSTSSLLPPICKRSIEDFLPK